jgi:hypothetical protein
MKTEERWTKTVPIVLEKCPFVGNLVPQNLKENENEQLHFLQNHQRGVFQYESNGG